MDGPLVEARALSRKFGKSAAVENLDFDIRAGEVFGLLGPNGAGKTTTLRMLLGLLMPTSGTAVVVGLVRLIAWIMVTGERDRKACVLVRECERARAMGGSRR